MHALELNEYKQYQFQKEKDFDSLQQKKKKFLNSSNSSCSLEYEVYGWNPYWMGTAYENYDYSLLSTVSYFSYEVNPNTGSYDDIHYWKTTSLVDSAHNNGVRVELCVTNFGSTDNATLLGNSSAKQTLIDSLISLVIYRNADGVNIDFEEVSSSQKTSLTQFMIALCNQMHAAIPGSTISMAIPAVDWSNVYDVASLNSYVDRFIIMGYGYHYSGSTEAGPTANLYSGSIWSSYNLVKSVNYYLDKGASNTKLMLGVPYYGYVWKTATSSIPSTTLASGTAKYYNSVKNNYWGTYTRQTDAHSNSPYYAFQSSGAWYQCWADDEYSLAGTYDMVKQKNIAGIGIWALGYDDGYTELWDLLEDKFSSCSITACSDTLYDMGGPHGEYYNNEEYTFTIAPDNASSVTLDFLSLDLENNYDYLYIYDGYNTSASLLGTYTGSSLPTSITSSMGAVTLKFVSDGATTNDGWGLVYNCNEDDIDPTTTFSVNNWYTEDFYLSFSDADNNGGSGLNEKFYLVSDFDGSNWSANATNGFCNDYFDVLNSSWISSIGTWAVNTGVLQQTDETQSNTNLYEALDQTSSYSYLYSWKAMMSGSGTNKRAGIHFFCDDASQSERGNSYFVYFREDDDLAQIYKVINNSYNLEVSSPCSIDENVWYDYKVTFNPSSGEIQAYKNDELVASWTDPSPHQSGNYISLRTGNASVSYDDLRVYKSRGTNVKAKVGSGTSNDIRYQNVGKNNPSAMVASIVSDMAHNWSSVIEKDLNIDWSIPSSINNVYDGLNADQDSCDGYGIISANWTSSKDSHSGIAAYWYAIGTAPGLSDVESWTKVLALDFTVTNLPLQNNTIYYVGIKSENNAGLFSDSSYSDGQLNVYGTYTGISDMSNKEVAVSVFPNPFSLETQIILNALVDQQEAMVEMFDYTGKLVSTVFDGYLEKGQHRFFLDGDKMSSGVYMVKVSSNGASMIYRIVKI